MLLDPQSAKCDFLSNIFELEVATATQINVGADGVDLQAAGTVDMCPDAAKSLLAGLSLEDGHLKVVCDAVSGRILSVSK